MIAWDDHFCLGLAARGFHVIRFDDRDAGFSTHFDDAGDPNLLARWNALSRRRPVPPPPYQLSDMADDAAALLGCLTSIVRDEQRDRPAVVIAHTAKGKGIDYMERDFGWHIGYLADVDRENALTALEQRP